MLFKVTTVLISLFKLSHDKDVLKLINNLIRNNTPKGSTNHDPFWEKSEMALLQALIFYLVNEAPPHEQNFSMIMTMLEYAEVKEEKDDYISPLDLLFMGATRGRLIDCLAYRNI